MAEWTGMIGGRLSRALTMPGWFERLAGGRARGHAIVLLAAVLALDTADLGTVGAVAANLDRALSLSNTDVGILAAAPSLCSAVVTLPMGRLVDRLNRVRLLYLSMVVWALAEAASALAASTLELLLVRIVLGAATAATLPAVASLVGDLFPPSERGDIWGLILSGELIGAAFGYLVAGEAASFGTGSWRLAFVVLAIPSLFAAYALRRGLHEPVRGGAGRLHRGDARDDAGPAGPAGSEPTIPDAPSDRALGSQLDPARMSFLQAVRMVLSIRTNVVLIVASALGYFYFTGVSTFGLEYFQGRYHLPHSTATLLITALGVGGLVGVVAGGRLADGGPEAGRPNQRILVGALSFAGAALMFLPGLLTSSVGLALVFMLLAGVFFGARNPPLDAARLDIVHHRLWGRAEAVRGFLRRLLTSTAPIVFGVVADAFAPGRMRAAHAGAASFGLNPNAHRIELACLILLVTLVLGGLLTLLATRTYPEDVAAAQALERATGSG